MSTISALIAKPILDSRGHWTVAVELTTAAGSVKTGVPAGASRGRREAVPISAEAAVAAINQVIGPAMIGRPVTNQAAVDNELLALDGTADKSHLGANALLGVSQAILKAAALEQNRPLWHYVKELTGTMTDTTDPRLLVNLINGGVHGGGQLAFQEYLFIPRAESLSAAINDSVVVYHRLKEQLIEKYGPAAVNLGDEGGFTPPIDDPREPFALISRAAGDLAFDLGLDAAGNELPRPVEVDWYRQLVDDWPLVMIEDPLVEDDLAGFSRLKTGWPANCKVIGDDLTVSRSELIEQAAQAKAIDGVIIKPNQVGTITETIEAVKTANRLGLVVIVSHRSGETNDDLIADLAVGLGAWGFKLGAPARGERVAKYNRLLEIKQELLTI